MQSFQWLEKFLLDDEGASAIEYSLLAALIAATVLTTTASLGSAVDAMYVGAMNQLTAAIAGS